MCVYLCSDLTAAFLPPQNTHTLVFFPPGVCWVLVQQLNPLSRRFDGPCCVSRERDNDVHVSRALHGAHSQQRGGSEVGVSFYFCFLGCYEEEKEERREKKGEEGRRREREKKSDGRVPSSESKEQRRSDDGPSLGTQCVQSISNVLYFCGPLRSSIPFIHSSIHPFHPFHPSIPFIQVRVLLGDGPDIPHPLYHGRVFNHCRHPCRFK